MQVTLGNNLQVTISNMWSERNLLAFICSANFGLHHCTSPLEDPIWSRWSGFGRAAEETVKREALFMNHRNNSKRFHSENWFSLRKNLERTYFERAWPRIVGEENSKLRHYSFHVQLLVLLVNPTCWSYWSKLVLIVGLDCWSYSLLLFVSLTCWSYSF